MSDELEKCGCAACMAALRRIGYEALEKQRDELSDRLLTLKADHEDEISEMRAAAVERDELLGDMRELLELACGFDYDDVLRIDELRAKWADVK